jgi:hypothetical protein
MPARFSPSLRLTSAGLAAVLGAGSLGCNAVFGIEEGTLGAGPAPSYDGANRWVKNSSSEEFVSGEAIAFGESADVIVTGGNSGNTIFGQDPVPYQGDPEVKDDDLFLVSYDRESGTHRWSTAFGGFGGQRGKGVAVDRSSGAVVVTGELYGSMTIGETTLSASGGTITQGDIFVAKFYPDGSPLWSQRFGDDVEQSGARVAVDQGGNILVAGIGWGLVDFGGGPKGQADEPGFFLAKLDPVGGHLWSHAYQTSHFYPTFHLGVAVDADDNVILAGSTDGSAIFGNGPEPTYGGADAFVIKLDRDGGYLWSRIFGGAGPTESNGDQWIHAVAVNAAGDIFVTGGFLESIRFDKDQTLTNTAPASEGSAGGPDAFLAKLRGADGAVEWFRGYGDAGDQQGLGVAADPSGNVVITGALIDDPASTGVDLGGGMKWPGPGAHDGTYRADLFLAKLSGTGDPLWSARFGNIYEQRGLDVAADASGNTVLTGEFADKLDFAALQGGNITALDRIDMFAAMFRP